MAGKIPNRTDLENMKQDIDDIESIVNSVEDQDVVTRLGKVHKSLTGRFNDLQTKLDAKDAEGQAALATAKDKLVRYAAVNYKGDFVAGTAYEANDVWKNPADNTLWIVPVDYTSGATAQADIDAKSVRPHQDRDRVVSVDTVADLRLIGDRYPGMKVSVSGHTEVGIGGGDYLWNIGDYTDDVIADNRGVTIAASDDETGEFGVWVKRIGSVLDVTEFGIRPGVYSDSDVSTWLSVCKDIGVKPHSDIDIHVTNLSIPTGLHFSGLGKFYGTMLGARPTFESLDSTDSAGRLALLRSAYGSEISFVGGDVVKGELTIHDCLITKNGGAGNNVISRGELNLVGVSSSGIGFKAIGRGSIDSENGLTVCDPAGVGLHVEAGGNIYVDSSPEIIAAGSRDAYVQNGGVIHCPGIRTSGSLNDSICILYGGSINAREAVINSPVGHGVVINYGGSINFANGVISDSQQSAITCESNGAIYANGAVLSGSADSGVTTAFGGIVNMASGDISNSANFDAYAIGSGFINLFETNIAGDSNGGGVMLRAIGSGIIYSEGPGGTGKTALSSLNYSPGYNRVGNGVAYIGEYTHDDATVSTARHVVTGTKEVTISAGVITVDRSFHKVDTEADAATDDLDTILGGETGVRLVLKAAHSARTVVLKDGVGNLALAGGDFELDHENDRIEMIYAENGVWCELSRASNN